MKIKRLVSIILCFSLLFNSISVAFAEEQNPNRASSSETFFSTATSSETDSDEDGYASNFEEVSEKDDQDDINISTPSDTNEKSAFNYESEGDDDTATSSDIKNKSENEDETDSTIASTSEATDDEETVASESDLVPINDNGTVKVINTATVSEIEDIKIEHVATTSNMILNENLFGNDGKTIISANVLHGPNKTVYLKSSSISIDMNGLVIRYTLEDASGAISYEDISYSSSTYSSNWSFGDQNKRLPNPEVLGAHEIEIRYFGSDHVNYASNFPVSVTVYVKELSNIEVLDPPTKTTYKGGEVLNMSGLVVRAHYTDGSHDDFENPSSSYSLWNYKLKGNTNDNYTISDFSNSIILLPYDNSIEITYHNKTTSFPITVSGIYTKWDFAECCYNEDNKTFTVLRSRYTPVESYGSVRKDCVITYPMKSLTGGGNSFISTGDDVHLMIYNNAEKIVFDKGVKVKSWHMTMNGVLHKVFSASMNGMPKLKEVVFKNIDFERNDEYEKQIDSLYSLFDNCTSLETVDLSPIIYQVNDLTHCFRNCKNLKSIKVSNSNVKTFDNMFYDSAAPGNLDLSSLYVDNIDNVSMKNMFRNVSVAGTVTLTHFQCKKENCNTENMFTGANFGSIRIKYGDAFLNCGFKALPEASWRCVETGDTFDTNEEMWNWHISDTEYVNRTYAPLNKIENILIVDNPTKLTYTYNENLDLSGLRIKASYTDGSEEYITYNNTTSSRFSICNLYGSVVSKAGDTKYHKIKYKDLISSNEICFNINNVPDFTSVSDLQVHSNAVLRDDGLDNWNLGESFVENFKKVTPLIMYKENGKSTYSLFLTYYSKKIGDDFSPLDYEKVHSFSGPEGNVSEGNYELDGYYKNLYYKLGIAVDDNGNVDFDILNFGLLNNLSVAKNPNKLNYIVGETFDPSGLVLRLNNTNNCYKDIVYNDDTKDNFTLSPSIDTPLDENVQNITITYYGKTYSLPINVSAPSSTRTITFEAGHGIASITANVALNAHILKINDPITEGYDFDYWYETDENTEYDFTNSVVTGDMTLHAKWNEKSYSLRYLEFNDGSGWRYIAAKDTNRLYHESIDTLTAPNERTGYTFLGWYDNGNLTGSVITSIPAYTTKNVKLYAKMASKYL